MDAGLEDLFFFWETFRFFLFVYATVDKLRDTSFKRTAQIRRKGEKANWFPISGFHKERFKK